MFSSLLLIIAVGGALFGVRRWQLLPDQERKSFAKKGLIYGSAGLVLVFVLTGRAHWLMGVLAALLALAGRAAQFAQYAPLFKKMMGKDQPQSSSSSRAPNAQPTMSRQEAADILSVDIDASESAIKMAHKRLMQKMHPDRGGSDALARQINIAKDTLLK